MPPSRAGKRPAASSAPFVYIGAGGYGQHKVSDAPGYKKGARGPLRTGILITRAETKDGALQEVGFYDGPEFGYLSYNATNRHLYGVSNDGLLHAFSISARDGSLTEVSCSDTLGCSAFVEVSPDGRHALVANYGDGVLAVLPLAADGAIGPASDSKLHWYEPEDESLADRQEASHPHQIRIAPRASATDTQYALACDLGADVVWVYEYDPVRGALIGASNSELHLQLALGGPRHLDFHPSGRWVYVLCELSGEVVTCTWDAHSGRLTKVGAVHALDKGVACNRAHHSGNSHIVCAPDGRHVYATTRAPNCVVVFGVHAKRGTLTRLQSVSTRGLCPRNFDLTPSRLRVYNQDSHTLVEFVRRDDGILEEEPASVRTFKGVCGQVLCEVAV